MSDSEKVKYVLELDVPGLAKGEGVEIPGLGVFENGYSYEITNEMAEHYRDMHSTVVDEVDDENVIVSSSVERGKTLLETSSGMLEGISVSAAASTPPKDKDKDKGGDK